MLILLDMDEILSDLISGVNALYNERNGTSFARSDYFSCNWWEVWGCEYEYADRLCHEFVIGSGHAEMQPISGSVEGVKRLGRDHRLFVATSRKLEYKALTRAWLDKVYGNGAFTEIYLLNHYGEGEKVTKSEVGKRLGVNLAIDDQVRHAVDLTSAGIPCLVLDSPWNKGQELPDLATRVYSWDDILREVDKRK